MKTVLLLAVVALASAVVLRQALTCDGTDCITCAGTTGCAWTQKRCVSLTAIKNDMFKRTTRKEECDSNTDDNSSSEFKNPLGYHTGGCGGMNDCDYIIAPSTYSASGESSGSGTFIQGASAISAVHPDEHSKEKKLIEVTGEQSKEFIEVEHSKEDKKFIEVEHSKEDKKFIQLSHPEHSKEKAAFIQHPEHSKEKAAFIQHPEHSKEKAAFIAHPEHSKEKAASASFIELSHPEHSKEKAAFIAHPEHSKEKAAFIQHPEHSKEKAAFIAHPEHSKEGKKAAFIQLGEYEDAKIENAYDGLKLYEEDDEEIRKGAQSVLEEAGESLAKMEDVFAEHKLTKVVEAKVQV